MGFKFRVRHLVELVQVRVWGWESITRMNVLTKVEVQGGVCVCYLPIDSSSLHLLDQWSTEAALPKHERSSAWVNCG